MKKQTVTFRADRNWVKTLDRAARSLDRDRSALELTQEEFALRYHIPIGTLRDWEQGRAIPDQPTQAYLKLIARDPEHVNRTLNRRREQAL